MLKWSSSSAMTAFIWQIQIPLVWTLKKIGIVKLSLPPPGSPSTHKQQSPEF